MPKRCLTFVAIATISMFGLASCDWSQFRFDPTHSGDNNVIETAISTSNVSDLVLNFKGTGGGGSMSSPEVANGVVYTGSNNGNLDAFDAGGNTNCSGVHKRCAPLWTASTGAGSFDSSPAVVDGVVYIGSEDHTLYAFDAAGTTNCSGAPKTCAPLWTGSTGGGIDSSPAVVNGVVYIGSDDGNLYAFDAAGTTNCSGTPKVCAPLWNAAVGGRVFSSPAVSNGIVYAGSLDGGNVYAFDAAGNTSCSGTPKTCTPLWTYHTGDVSSSPAVVNGVVYVGDFLSKVSAFDASGNTKCSGTPKVCDPLWAAGVNSSIGIVSSPAVADGTVYLGDECNFSGSPPEPVCDDPPHFFAFDAATGAVRWTAIATSGPVTSSPGIANGLVFVGSGAGKLYAFDAAGSTHCSGTPTFCSPLWTGATGGGTDSSPAIANGKVYVGGGDGNLYVFGLPH